MKRFEVYAQDERTIRLKERFFRAQGFDPLPPWETESGDWRMWVQQVTV